MLLLWIIFDVCVSCSSVILSCLLLAALWSQAEKELTLCSLLCEFFLCVFVTFSYGVQDLVWY